MVRHHFKSTEVAVLSWCGDGTANSFQAVLSWCGDGTANSFQASLSYGAAMKVLVWFVALEYLLS